MLQACSSRVAAGATISSSHCLQLACSNAVYLVDQGSTGSPQSSQQQAWLPQHTAAAALTTALRDVTQLVWRSLFSSAAVLQPLSTTPRLPGKQYVAPQLSNSSSSRQGAGSGCIPRAAASSCFVPARHAHTAADRQSVAQHSRSSSSSSSRSRAAGMGRLHPPLFKHRPDDSSHQSIAQAAAAAACAEQQQQQEYEEEDAHQQQVTAPTDLRDPHQWYPTARAMAPRSLIAHLGPTNSGKTHASLAALAAAPSGIYCGPLRLLACEVADRLNSMGVPCNLVTGQEIRRVKGARHTACTVEMADLSSSVDVAVLDEVQMLGDKGRGWSWTRVLLGLPAAELHLCGDPAAAALLEQVAADCGDRLTIKRYRRLAPLVIEPDALGGLHQVQDGDCVVAFGRKTLHRLRGNILHHMLGADPDHDQAAAAAAAAGVSEAAHDASSPSSPSDSEDDDPYTGDAPGWYSNSCSSSSSDGESEGLGSRLLQQQQQQRMQAAAAGRAGFQGVGMVYGALPPESRRTQAALFNARGDDSPRTSVLVASDAVGMGLNLNIRRIVFTTLYKYDGVETRRLSASEIKQIAGRAGRYASGHSEGYVSVLNADDLPLLREALATATPAVTQACLLPRFEQLEQFALDHAEARRHHHDSSSNSDDEGSSSSLGRHRCRPLPFHKLLQAFVGGCQLSGVYFLADIKNMLLLAKLLRHIEPRLDLWDMYTCCISPASADDGPVVQALLQVAGAYAYDRHVTPDCITLPCPDRPPRSPAEMKTAEEVFRVYDLYLWLFDRLGAPGVFRGRRRVLRQRQQVAALIDVALQEMGGVPLAHSRRKMVG